MPPKKVLPDLKQHIDYICMVPFCSSKAEAAKKAGLPKWLQHNPNRIDEKLEKWLGRDRFVELLQTTIRAEEVIGRLHDLMYSERPIIVKDDVKMVSDNMASLKAIEILGKFAGIDSSAVNGADNPASGGVQINIQLNNAA